jgi:hypothetical protein
MPTSALLTFNGANIVPLKNDEDARMEDIQLKASTTFAAGTLVGELSGTPGTYAPYASGNSDGSQLPTHIVKYACKTDSSKNSTIGDGTTGNEWGVKVPAMPAYRCGYFACEDIVGLDANAVTALKARLTQGSTTTGRIMIPGA